MNEKLVHFLTALIVVLPTVAQADFTPIVGWDKQLFPSFIIGTAAMKTDEIELGPNELGDTNGLLGIQIVAPHDDAAIEITIECNEFAEPSRFSGNLENEGETYTILPKMKYRFDRLSQCTQATPASVSFRVVIDGKEVEEKSTVVTVRSINDCPLLFQNGETQYDTSFAFACYVNEQHPFIDKLLREALDRGVVKNFIGYQGKTEVSVLTQVYAIWDVLVARDVRYSSITKTAAESDLVFGQNVRLLEDTINNQQANCVDGSVLLVSILRKIGIEAELVLVPGHCYIRFYLDPKFTKFVALETTLMGVEVSEDQNEDGFLEGTIDESLQDQYSWPSFVEAIREGKKNFDAAKEQLESKAENGYQIVDISAARKLGVLPIPYRSTEVFVSFDHSSAEEDWSEESDAEEGEEESWEEGTEGEEEDEDEEDEEEVK